MLVVWGIFDVFVGIGSVCVVGVVGADVQASVYFLPHCNVTLSGMKALQKPSFLPSLKHLAHRTPMLLRRAENYPPICFLKT